MQYLLLIYDNEAAWNKMPESERNAMYKEYGEFTQSIMQTPNPATPATIWFFVHVEMKVPTASSEPPCSSKPR